MPTLGLGARHTFIFRRVTLSHPSREGEAGDQICFLEEQVTTLLATTSPPFHILLFFIASRSMSTSRESWVWLSCAPPHQWAIVAIGFKQKLQKHLVTTMVHNVNIKQLLVSFLCPSRHLQIADIAASPPQLPKTARTEGAEALWRLAQPQEICQIKSQALAWGGPYFCSGHAVFCRDFRRLIES